MMGHLLPRFWSVGASTADLGSAVLTHRHGLADEPTATFLHRVRSTTVEDLTATVTRAHEITGTPCPRVFLDRRTPALVEAALVARDWRIGAVLQLVLPAAGAVPFPDTTPTIRPARTADWDELAALFRADHEEEDRTAARPIRPPEATRRVVAARRRLPDPVRYFVAVDDGIVGFVAGWPGEDGTGLVEDLFVRPSHRGRKLATALVARAVAWARPGGAREVVIGAEPEDTPKHLYARLGFVPTEVLRTATADAASSPVGGRGACTTPGGS